MTIEKNGRLYKSQECVMWCYLSLIYIADTVPFSWQVWPTMHFAIPHHLCIKPYHLVSANWALYAMQWARIKRQLFRCINGCSN